MPPNGVQTRLFRVDVDELFVLGDFGEGVDPVLVDDEPMRDEGPADVLMKVARLERRAAHSSPPNIGGRVVTLISPSTGTIAPVV